MFPTSGRKQLVRKRKGETEKSTASAIVKAIQDLKVDTQIRGSPRIADPPRIFLKNRKKFTLNQTYSYGTVVVPTANTFVAGTVYIYLSGSPISASLVQCFDTYRIEQCTVRFVPTTTGFGAASGGLNPLLTVIDYDDSTALVNTPAAQAYDTCQETPFGQYVERTFIPRTAVATYTGGAFTGYSQNRGWVDCNSNSVAWYGLKWVCAGIPVAQSSIYSIEVDFIVTLVSVR
jgi:hypothetical protein